MRTGQKNSTKTNTTGRTAFPKSRAQTPLLLIARHGTELWRQDAKAALPTKNSGERSLTGHFKLKQMRCPAIRFRGAKLRFPSTSTADPTKCLRHARPPRLPMAPSKPQVIRQLTELTVRVRQQPDGLRLIVGNRTRLRFYGSLFHRSLTRLIDAGAERPPRSHLSADPVITGFHARNSPRRPADRNLA